MFALYDDERKALVQAAVLLACAAAAILPFTHPPSGVAARGEPYREPPRTARHSWTLGRRRSTTIAVRRDPFVPDPRFAPESAQFQVQAVALGADPRALVEVDGAVRVVAVGDRIGSDRVVSIGARGLRLASGRSIAVRTPQ